MHKGQQISFSRQDIATLRMPPVCAITGEPAVTAIIVRFGGVDLILPASDRTRSDHQRPLGAVRTAWRLRPSIRDGVVNLHNLPGEFVEQLLKINEPGSVYVGGLYPLKVTRPTHQRTGVLQQKAA